MAEDKYKLGIELSLDTVELTQGLKRVKDDLKTSKEEMKSIDKELKDNPKNVDAWKRKQALLNKTIEDTKKKLSLQTKQLEQANKEFDGSDKARKKIEVLKTSINRTTNEIARLENQTRETEKALKDASKVDFTKLTSIGGSLTKNVSLPIIGAIASLGGVALSTADKIDEIADKAERVGASAVGYQELIYVTKLLGGNADALQRGFIKINSMMGDIASGNSLKAAQTLSKLGLTIEDVKGKDTTEVFKILREEIAKLGDEALMADMANQIFGDRIGSELLPVLKADAETIGKLTNEAHNLGIANEEQIEIAGKFNDELDKLKQAFFGVQITIMEMMLPTLEKLANKVKEEVVPKLKELKSWWEDLETSQQKTILSVTGVALAIGPMLSIIGKLSSAIGVVISSIGGIGTAITSVNPKVALIVGAIAGLIAIGKHAYDTNEEFRNSVNELGQSLIKLLEPLMAIANELIQALLPVIKEMMDSLKPLLDEVVIPILNTMTKSLLPVIKEIIDLLKPLLDKIVLPIINLMTKALLPILETLTPILKMISSILSPFIELISKMLVPALQLIEKILSPILNLIEKIVEKVSTLIEKTSGPLKKSIEWVSDKVGKVGDFFGNLVDKASQGLKDLFSGKSKSISANIEPSVPNYLTGNSSASNGGYGAMRSVNNNTNNNVNVYTTSSVFDVDSINIALGGNYL